MIVEIKLDGTPVMIRITDYWPAMAATEFEPPEPEYIEFMGATAETEAIIQEFNLHDKLRDRVLDAFKAARADNEENFAP